MNWNRWITALAVLSLLTGCAPAASSSSPSSPSASSDAPQQSVSSSQPETLPKGDSLEGEGPQQVMRLFIEALETHSAGKLSSALNIANLDGTPYTAWLGTEFTDITATVLSTEGDEGRYEVHFQVGGSDDSVFPRGAVTTLVVEVGFDTFNFEGYGVKAIYDPSSFFYEQRPYDETQPGFDAYWFVSDYLHKMNTALFDRPDQLSPEEITDYALLACAAEYEDKTVFTPEDVSRMVALRFGIEDFDGTGTRYYNADEGYFEVWGRGGLNRRMHTTAVELRGEETVVSVTFYGDPFCLYPVEWVEYTLRTAEDGGYQFVSAKRVPQEEPAVPTE